MIQQYEYILTSIHFLRANYSSIWIHFSVDSFSACVRFSHMNTFCSRFICCVPTILNTNTFAVDWIPACLWFCHMKTFAVNSFPACVRLSDMNTFCRWFIFFVHTIQPYELIWIHFEVESFALFWRFSNMNTYCSRFISACLQSSYMNTFRSWFISSVLTIL